MKLLVFGWTPNIHQNSLSYTLGGIRATPLSSILKGQSFMTEVPNPLQKTYFVARSFTTEDPKEAWNITSFLSNYGLVGMASILLKEGIGGEELVRRV